MDKFYIKIFRVSFLSQILYNLHMSKRMLMVSKIMDANIFIPLFQNMGVEVHQIEDFGEALEDALDWKPGVIVFLVPVYWESILEFVEKVRADPDMKKTGIIYVGRLIEGAELRLLQQHDVKTMAMGPVPEEEMARFMYEMFPAW